ncbi:malto-oligosyltrehalose trehalohydrolase [Roseomonas marmotae]|uniref:Malto-oligosyltrehalose trehalohydrolase n=1 Tax=Roseomonas marmotae TaxID=2768161 RepID=A0ABS3K8U9_9PROT|nr:malto-oligosyltrehalose trehalohydrolase [Roseomonas marmotae]MBO1073885.1 malto-oligosyltrehalose trehalohydrolase [Roseomonas marmotae]QTI78494.1 malto-oligosyltrehalose trehalohydrolase [Roseomonas marmotae]
MTTSFSFGAIPTGGGKARFRLWAPGQDSLTLLRQGQDDIPMHRGADGWWEAEAEAPPGARYRYRLGDGMEVPDPASRAQHGDVDGWSLVVDHGAYQWQQPDWKGQPWPRAVIYELHAGLYGGFRGIIDDLPRLAALGVNTVELMPVNAFAGLRNWGYDGVLPYAPDETYGTPDDLKALVDAAHGHGLSVMLDVVYNHFGPSGNYWGAIAPAFFHQDKANPWGQSIDFTRREVRDFFIENALYWLAEYRFDGLRLDAVHAIEDDSFLPELSARIREATAGRHVHLVLENERNDAMLLEAHFDAQWNDDLHHCLHVLLTGEHDAYYIDYAEDTADKLARALSSGFVYQGQISKNLGHQRGKPSAHLPPSAFVNALQTHDQVGNRAMGERIAQIAPPEGVRAALLLLLLSPQIPMLFMGDEWASKRPFLFFTGFTDDGLAEAVREGRRKEFARFPAFADPARREKIPDPNDPATFTMSRPDPAERMDPRHVEVEEFVAALLRQRRERLAQRLDGTTSLAAETLGERGVRVQWRLGDGAVLTIAAQFGPDSVPCPTGPGTLLAESRGGLAAALEARGLGGFGAIAWLATETRIAETLW